MKEPLVSVIMPAFNAANHIAAAIQSVLDQSYRCWELIIIDDGSQDGTADIVRRYELTDERIKYVHQENSGPSKARNQGIKQSSGVLIAFLDADDLWLSGKLQLQVDAIQQHNADIVFSDGFFFLHPNELDESNSFGRVKDEIGWGKIEGEQMFQRLFNGSSIPILSVLARKNVSGRLVLFDESYRYASCEDYDLWLRLASQGASFLGLPEKLVRYRVHPGQATKNNIEILRAELVALQKHQDTTLVSETEKARRFRAIYRRLVMSLVDDHRTSEARQYLRELLARERFKSSTLAQAALLWLFPGYYKTVLKFVCRARASLSYRVSRPLRDAWRARERGPRIEN